MYLVTIIVINIGYVQSKGSFCNHMQCHRRRALDEFFSGIQSNPVKLAVVGCGCSVATEPVSRNQP